MFINILTIFPDRYHCLLFKFARTYPPHLKKSVFGFHARARPPNSKEEN